jgi:hypothetical protein
LCQSAEFIRPIRDGPANAHWTVTEVPWAAIGLLCPSRDLTVE